MKKIFFKIVLALLLSNSVFGQTNNPFPYLTEITNSADSSVHLYVDKGNAEIINKKLKDLDEEHSLYTANDDCESEMVLLAIAPINDTHKKYAIIYGHCPESEFHLYGADDISKYYGSVSGLKMYVTGNGNLYVSGHVNSNFNHKRKFSFEEDKITEVKQPYYHVGLKTKTLNPLTIYRSKHMYDEVATLPENYKIEVVLAESNHQYEGLYLIKTDFGLTGWAKIKAGQYQSIDVEGIFWNGD